MDKGRFGSLAHTHCAAQLPSLWLGALTHTEAAWDGPTDRPGRGQQAGVIGSVSYRHGKAGRSKWSFADRVCQSGPVPFPLEALERRKQRLELVARISLGASLSPRRQAVQNVNDEGGQQSRPSPALVSPVSPFCPAHRTERRKTALLFRSRGSVFCFSR